MAPPQLNNQISQEQERWQRSQKRRASFCVCAFGFPHCGRWSLVFHDMSVLLGSFRPCYSGLNVWFAWTNNVSKEWKHTGFRLKAGRLLCSSMPRWSTLTSLIPALGRLRQEDREFEESLSYAVRCLLLKQTKPKPKLKPKQIKTNTTSFVLFHSLSKLLPPARGRSQEHLTQGERLWAMNSVLLSPSQMS